MAEKRGSGAGSNYIPWIYISELNSRGTCSAFIDWKTGRTVQLLSQGEVKAYIRLRWDDRVSDIREQFPLLDLESTVRIAEQYGFVHPHFGQEKTIMTTDLMVFYTDGKRKAFSCKPNRTTLSERAKQKLLIEKEYWNQKEVPWELIFTDEINAAYINNIRNAVRYYDKDDVFDPVSKAKYLVAHKSIAVDLNKPINWVNLAKELEL